MCLDLGRGNWHEKLRPPSVRNLAQSRRILSILIRWLDQQKNAPTSLFTDVSRLRDRERQAPASARLGLEQRRDPRPAEAFPVALLPLVSPSLRRLATLLRRKRASIQARPRERPADAQTNGRAFQACENPPLADLADLG